MPLTFKELKEFTVQQLATLKKEYEPMRGKTISIDNAKKLSNKLDVLTKDMLKKLANANIPFVSTSASSKLVTKHRMNPADIKETINLEEADELQQEACWTGYKQVGFKKSGRTGKRVPNCVPESVVKEMFGDMINEINDLRGSLTDAQLERMKQEWENKPASALTQGVKQMIMNMDAPTRAALEHAKINHISKFAGSTFEQNESVEPIEEVSQTQPYSRYIANKMMKNKTMKSFAPKVAKMLVVRPSDLEKMLPDYVDGADIAKLFETPMMSMNKQSPEYKQGQQAAKQGKKYIDNPHSDAQKKLNWSGGHNAYRLMNMAEERTYTVVHVGHDKEVVKANGTYDAAKKYAQMKGLKDTSGVDAHLMEKGFASDANSPEYKEGEKAAKQGKSYSDNPYMKSNSFSAVDKRLNWAGGLENAYGTGKGHVFFNIKKESMSVNEGMFKKLLQTIHDKLEREGGAAGYDDLAKEVKKELDLDISKDTLKNMPGVKQHRDGDYILEADLSKSQVNMVHKKADDMPKKDFIKRYGKDGDSVRYATATNMVKKQLGIEEEEFVPEQKQKGDNMNEATYKDKFKAAMKDFGINSLDDLDSDADKKKFFKHVDAMHTAKNEELTPAQKKLPVGLQKAIKDKEDKKPKSNVAKINKMRGIMVDSKEENTNESKDMDKLDRADRAQARTRKARRAMQQDRIKQQQALTNPKNEIKKEGFASDAQRKAAFASGYKEKGKKKKEEVSEMMKPQEMAVNAMAMNAMKMNAMKMPIRAMYKKEMKTGDDDMTPDALKLNAMVKDPHKSKEDKPMKDMNAMYMKSDVRADVKNNGGADMSKVKDAPKMQTAMKKINAMYKTEKYLPTKDNSINDAVAQMQVNEMKTVNVRVKELSQMVEKYLLSGGVKGNINLEIAEGKQVLPLKEVRTFVDTYNKHFLTNYKTEELLER